MVLYASRWRVVAQLLKCFDFWTGEYDRLAKPLNGYRSPSLLSSEVELTIHFTRQRRMDTYVSILLLFSLFFHRFDPKIIQVERFWFLILERQYKLTMYQYDDLITDDEDDEFPPGWPKNVTVAPPCYSAPLHLNNVESYSDKNFQPAYPSIFGDVDFRALLDCQQVASTSSISNFDKSKNCKKNNVKDDSLLNLITDDEDDEVQFIDTDKSKF